MTRSDRPGRPLRVLLAGGGTAGHVQPLLALADELRARDPDVSLLVLGTASGLEHRLVPARGYTLAEVDRVPLPRRPGADLARLPSRLARAVAQAGAAIDAVGGAGGRTGRADVVVGFGGYVATPAYLAAARRRVPIVVHEQNARPGVANRVGAALSSRVAVTFAPTALRSGLGPRAGAATVTGMPLRPEITGLDRAALRAQARSSFGLDAGAPVLLVTGGSLGAVHVNTAVEAAAPDLLAAGVQVLHLTGAGKAVVSAGPGHRVREYADRMDLAYAAADLVLCRAGAGTVCEVTAVGLPAVYVPLAVGNGEQRLNAAPVVAAGGALMIADGDLDAAALHDVVLPLLTDHARLAAAARAAGEVGVADGAARLADLVESAVRAPARRAS